MIFYLFILLLIAQRIGELVLARNNEERMKKEGGLEFGMSHYPWIVLLHLGFFISLFAEYKLFDQKPSSYWMIWLSLFLLAQVGRVWVISSLGQYWNTKIIVMPSADPVSRGPYKYIKHPNYVIVAVEIIVISLLFNAYITAIIFSCLNVWMMSIRIPIEERALSNLTSYAGHNLKSNKK